MYNGYHYYPYNPQGYYLHPHMQPNMPYFHPNPYEMESTSQEDNMERQVDHGNQPYVVNIENATEFNRAFRRVIWTGNYLQLVLMRIRPGEDIGLEVHPGTDQFVRIEDGNGIVQMGDRRNQLNYERRIKEDDAILIPAGKWHNIRNTGRKPLLLYTIYAPPEHRRGTVHRTKQDAMQHHNPNHGQHHGHRYDDGQGQML